MNQRKNISEQSLEFQANAMLSNYFARAAKKNCLVKDSLAFHLHVNTFSTTDNSIGSYSSMLTEHTREKLCCGYVDFFENGRAVVHLMNDIGKDVETIAIEEFKLSKAERRVVKKAIKKKLKSCVISVSREVSKLMAKTSGF